MRGDMKLPTKISPCPIKEANVEIRFDAFVPNEAVFGVLYNVFKDKLTDFKKLPISQVPTEIITKDPKLIYQPHYHAKYKGLNVMFGPKVVNVGSNEEYIGWTTYYKTIREITKKIMDTKILSKVTRIGIRYVNFFDYNIFPNTTMTVAMGNDDITKSDTTITTVKKSSKFLSKVTISNNALIEDSGLNGSIIDIDTYIEKDNISKASIDKLINEAHTEEKRLFFKIITNDYLETLNPDYR